MILNQVCPKSQINHKKSTSKLKKQTFKDIKYSLKNQEGKVDINQIFNHIYKS